MTDTILLILVVVGFFLAWYWIRWKVTGNVLSEKWYRWLFLLTVLYLSTLVYVAYTMFI